MRKRHMIYDNLMAVIHKIEAGEYDFEEGERERLARHVFAELEASLEG
ncbi:MAG: hypothetical protein IJ719_00235 [Clostridia bacterium]|nr:hypothetical protein [Clostridia bacterium]